MHILILKSRACTFWCCPHASRYTQPASVWRATVGWHHSWGDEGLPKITAASFSHHDLPTSSLFSEKSSFPLSFYAPASWSFYTASWTSYPALASTPVGNEHLCFSPVFKLASCFTGSLLLTFTQETDSWVHFERYWAFAHISALIISGPSTHSWSPYVSTTT